MAIIANLTDGTWDGSSDHILTDAGHELVCRRVWPVDVLILGTQTIKTGEVHAWKNVGVKGVVRLGVGYNNLPLQVLREAGIKLAYTPNAPSQAVAEHALALLMAALRIKGIDRAHPGRMLSEITVTLIGRGRIGKRFAAILHALNVGTLNAVDPVADTTFDEIHGVNHCELQAVLDRSDVVSLHVPLNDTTRLMVNKGFLEYMKPNAILINTSRGGVVNEADLSVHLMHNKEFTTCLDVREVEPYTNWQGDLSDGSAFPNVIHTPHVASMTIPARQAMEREANKAALAIVEGREPRWIIPEKEPWL